MCGGSEEIAMVKRLWSIVLHEIYIWYYKLTSLNDEVCVFIFSPLTTVKNQLVVTGADKKILRSLFIAEIRTYALISLVSIGSENTLNPLFGTTPWRVRLVVASRFRPVDIRRDRNSADIGRFVLTYTRPKKTYGEKTRLLHHESRLEPTNIDRYRKSTVVLEMRTFCSVYSTQLISIQTHSDIL